MSTNQPDLAARATNILGIPLGPSAGTVHDDLSRALDEVERLRGMLRGFGESNFVGEMDDGDTWVCPHCGQWSVGMDDIGHERGCPTREPWFAQEVSGG